MAIRFLGVDLSEGVGPRHLLAYLLVALISSGYAGAMSVLQPGLLQVMGIAFEEQGRVTGQLSALQEVVLIFTLGPIGALADRIGRRTVYVAGLLLTALGFAIYPFAQDIWQLVGFRIVVALGGAAMLGMMVTVIADYTRNSTRGKANGLQGLVATLGAFIPPLLAGLPAYFVAAGASELSAQQYTFGVAASLGTVGAIIAALGLSTAAGRASSAAATRFADILRDGFGAAREPGIALSYGAAFISRGDLAITGAFVFLWLVQIGVDRGMSPSEAMGALAAPRVLVVVVGAMVGALLMGYLADRVRKVTAVMLASGMASAVYLAMGFVEDISASWVFALLAMMGIAEISAFVGSQALVGQRARPDRRGAIIGFFGVAGAAGILVGTMSGGILFDTVRPSAPFLLFGVLNAAVFVWSITVRAREAALPEPAYEGAE